MRAFSQPAATCKVAVKSTRGYMWPAAAQQCGGSSAGMQGITCAGRGYGSMQSRRFSARAIPRYPCGFCCWRYGLKPDNFFPSSSSQLQRTLQLSKEQFHGKHSQTSHSHFYLSRQRRPDMDTHAFQVFLQGRIQIGAPC